MTATPRKIIISRNPQKQQARTKPRRSRNWHPEAALLSTMIESKMYHLVLEAGVTEDWFHAYTDEWRYVHRFIIRHKCTPTRKSLDRKFPDFDWQEPEDLSHLIDEVRQAHTRYSMLMLAAETTDSIREGIEPTEVLSIIERRVMSIHGQVEGSFGQQSSMTVDWEDTYAEVSARVARQVAGGMAGVTTGFPTLDNLTGGVDSGHYWVVGARLKGGKTWGLAQMTTSAAMQGHKVLYFSLEMPRRQMEMRMHNLMSSKFGQDVFRSIDLMQGRGVDLIQYKKFLKRMAVDLAGQIIIDDSSQKRVTPMGIAMQIEKHRPRLVFVDYLTLMSPSNDWQSIADTSMALKSLCSDYPDTSIIAAAQINRNGTGKEPPSADDLAGSDGIGRDVDAVVTMASQSNRVKKMMLAAYRHGPDKQKWYTSLDLNAGTFSEISGDRAQDLIDEDDLAASIAMDS